MFSLCPDAKTKWGEKTEKRGTAILLPFLFFFVFSFVSHYHPFPSLIPNSKSTATADRNEDVRREGKNLENSSLNCLGHALKRPDGKRGGFNI